MKGIGIISYHKTVGGYIECEYPKAITKSLNITPIGLNKIYTFNRMRSSEPNYTTVKVENNLFASYFTGLDSIICSGMPNKCIFLILDPSDPNEWEADLKQTALEILPKFENFLIQDNPNQEILTLIDNSELINQLKIRYELFRSSCESNINNPETVVSETLLPKSPNDMTIDGKIAKIEIKVWQEKVEELKHEKQELLKRIERLEMNLQSNYAKEMNSEKNLPNYSEMDISNETTENDPILHITKLTQKLKAANEDAQRKLQFLNERKAEFDANNIKIKELTDKLDVLKIELIEMEEQKNLEIQEKIELIELKDHRIFELQSSMESIQTEIFENPPISQQSSTQNSGMESKLKSLEFELEIKKQELINAKKLIKIQEKDISNLKHLLNLK